MYNNYYRELSVEQLKDTLVKQLDAYANMGMMEVVNSLSTKEERYGSITYALEDIDNDQATGVVKADGKIWTARSVSGKPIPAGSTVIIRSIEGVKVMVTPAE